jgi:hypothetical protein
LKNLDSDEEIQGNPTLMSGGLRSGMATSQENANGPGGPTSLPAAEKEPNRVHPNAKAPWRLGVDRRF